MLGIRTAILGFAILIPLMTLSAHPKAACDVPSLLNQRKDAATIQRLEDAWSTAYLKGDTNFERCLLTEDFAEIMRTGEVKALSDELALAEKNKDKKLPIPDFPKGTVLLHGNVAVAYGTSTHTGADGRSEELRYADYYGWENGGWHAFFAQQTEIEKK
jgi:hypothetical protein